MITVFFVGGEVCIPLIRKGHWMERQSKPDILHCFINPGRVGEWTSSETQGQLVVAGKRLNGRAKKSGEEKSSLKRPVPKPFKILACDWAQKISCSFRVTFVTSYSNVFIAKHFAHLIAILTFTCSYRRVSLDRKVQLKQEPWNRKKKVQI